jgi:hypothetical protein
MRTVVPEAQGISPRGPRAVRAPARARVPCGAPQVLACFSSTIFWFLVTTFSDPGILPRNTDSPGARGPAPPLYRERIDDDGSIVTDTWCDAPNPHPDPNPDPRCHTCRTEAWPVKRDPNPDPDPLTLTLTLGATPAASTVLRGRRTARTATTACATSTTTARSRATASARATTRASSPSSSPSPSPSLCSSSYRCSRRCRSTTSR